MAQKRHPLPVKGREEKNENTLPSSARLDLPSHSPASLFTQSEHQWHEQRKMLLILWLISPAWIPRAKLK